MYVKIRSWHVIRDQSSETQWVVALCGKGVAAAESGRGEVATSFGDEKSCETCLRIAAKAVGG